MQGNFVSSISGKRMRFVFNIVLPTIALGVGHKGLIIRKGNEIWETKNFKSYERKVKLGVIPDKKMPRATVSCTAIVNEGKQKRTTVAVNTITHPADQFNGVYGRTQAFIQLLEEMVNTGLITREDATDFFENATFRKSNDAYKHWFGKDHPKLYVAPKEKPVYVRELASV